MEHYDAIVIGMGPGGEVAASRLLDAGLRVAIVERELIGGECAYWACIPSKTLLRPTEARAEADRAAGLARPVLDWPMLRDYRDSMIRHLDDAAQAEGYRKQGATVIKGAARLAGTGRIEVDGQHLSADHVILATGSTSVRPPIDGLDQVPVWTNREATTLTDIPGRALLIGGSAVGVELGQFLARMGTRVTLVQRADRLLDREDPRLGEIVADRLAADGIDVRLNTQARAARRESGDTVVQLDDGSSVRTDVVILGAGRRPRTTDLALDTVGVQPGGRGELAVDEHCKLTDGLWALGDVTGKALFTHVAKYQGRIVSDAILGRPRAADYTAVPRVVFAEPEIAAVGLTTAQARERGIDTVSTELDVAESIARPWTYETDPRGTLALTADRSQRTVVGAWAIAPQAGEWIHTAALAIRHQLPVEALADTIAQFPTFTEAYATAAGRLLRDL
ncbi:dihydrolipoyl dehydrogenase family protein [Streptomyces gobiensis]|uniref:dihydrolipoyl dehydrogenase family protein n=1 Tax=Streptomyces gobiensis TaxID=2875706 RepID=UPI001E29CC6D|nr:NAD(P)/FAD-dependent oxidoreductase [Streptomyces gobiensis]UGY91265.1 NAD(P)/FAD-dependent oxidoreductase [Streptomyces gobiensis]